MFFTLPHYTGISTEALELDISLQARRSMGNWTITVRVLRIGTSRQMQQKPQGSRAPNPESTHPESYCTKNLFRSSHSAKSRTTRDCFPGHRHSSRQPGLLQGHERHRSTTAEVPALEGSDHQPAATPASSPRRSVAAAPFLREITRSQTPNLHSVMSYHVYKMASHRWCPMLPRDSGRVHAMSQAGQKARCLS